MATVLQKQTVPNLVQGVSQQAQQVRRNTQCDSQYDCLNHPVQGCTPRPGLERVASINTGDNTDAFFYDIVRSSTERYTVVLRKDGVLKAYNYLTGVECTINVLSSAATTYLAALASGNLPWNSYAMTTTDDTSFIANKTVAPAMDTSVKSGTRPFEALFVFKAGAYSNQYQIGVNYLGTWYNWSYTTPDNSVSGNAAYITPSAICYALYNAMVTDPTNPITTHLGFSIQRDANLIRLWRTTGSDFDIKTDDAQNNNFMIGLKDKIARFDQLPESGYDGMVYQVAGDTSTDADDYYVTFNSQGVTSTSTTQGAWEECPAKGTVLGFNSHTMPMVLVNDAVNHFTLGLGNWGVRLCGDGVISAKDPSFTGQLIEDMFFDQKRLCILTEASAVWSRVNNPYIFFPDTIQADLATAPIDELVKASKRIALLRHPLQTDDDTFLWAEGKQFRVGKVDNTIFSDQTIEVKSVTDYEWNEDLAPLSVGTSVIFATDVGQWSNVTDAAYDSGKSAGSTGITDHVPNYVPSPLRIIVGSDTVKKLALYSDTTPNLLYVYEYRIGQQQREQSAWNTWRLPTDCHIVHLWMDKDLLYVWVQRPTGMHLLRCSLRPAQTDPEGPYLTRLDMRITEDQCTVAFAAGVTTLTLPDDYSDDNTYLQATADNPTIQVVVRQGDGNEVIRGVVLTPTSITVAGGKTVLTFNQDLRGIPLYLGLRIRAERTENTFYAHDQDSGYIYDERLTVGSVVVSHSGSGYFRVEVTHDSGRFFSMPYEGKTYGDPDTIYDAIVLGQGDFPVSVNEKNTDVDVTLVSDTFLPCAWTGLTWFYTPTQKA